MKPLLKISITLLCATTSAESFSQCKFKTEKDEPGYRHIRHSIGPSLLQWNLSLGNSDKGAPVVWVRVVDGGARKKHMQATDVVILKFENGEDIFLHPTEPVKPVHITTGTLTTSHYFTRFEVTKEQMKKLSEQELKNVAAIIDGRDMDRDVKSRQRGDIMESAGCALN